MNASTLCTLLAQRINPTYFQLWGLDVHWMAPEYDTPANRAIVADVIANYSTLAPAAEQAEKDEAEKEKLIQAKIRDNAIADLKKEGKLDANGKIKK